MSVIRVHYEPSPTLVSDVYYYTVNDGKFRHFHGDIKTARITGQPYFVENYMGMIRKAFQCNCSTQPEEVWLRGLWLPEADILRAKQLLAAYEKEQIVILQKKIDRHLSILHILEE